MFSFKIFVALLIAVCFDHHCHGAVEVAKKFYDYDVVYEGRHSFNEGNLLYAICDPDSANGTSTCKIVQENYPYEEAAYSCLVNVDSNVAGPSPWSSSSIKFDLVVMALGEDKAVLYWFSRKKDSGAVINIGTVDMTTCEMNTVLMSNTTTILFMEFNHVNKFVPYSDDSFDIFYLDPKYHPENSALLKIQIDASGNVISQPKSANVDYGYYFKAATVATRSAAKGHAFVKRNQFKSRSDFRKYLRNPMMHLLLQKPDGAIRQLAEYYQSTNGEIAGGNNYISLCNRPEANGHIVCTQYDEDGNDVFTTTLLDSHSDSNIVKPHNLPNGGMLVMYGAKKCSSRRRGIGFEVVWIGSNGKVKGKLCTRQMEIDKGKVAVPYVYASGDKGYCATVVIKDDVLLTTAVTPGSFDVVTNCFTEDDLLA